MRVLIYMLVSYISIPLVSDDGSIKYVRVPLENICPLHVLAQRMVSNR